MMNKKIDITNPAHIKLALLSDGVVFDESALALVGNKIKEKVHSYNSSDFTDKINIPQEIILGDEIVVGTHWRNESPWIIKNINDVFKLYFQNQLISEVWLPERPKYYDIEVEKNVPIKRVCVTLGMGAVSFFVRNVCTYWENGLPCKFCSLKSTQSKFDETESYKSPQIMAKAMKIIKETGDHIHHIQFSGGSIWDHDKEMLQYIESIKAVSEVLGERIDGNLITMPPNDFSLIDKAYEAGINQISFNLEVWDSKMFKKVCPGKTKSYSREKMISALEYAAKVFKNGTYTTFVGGLEPLESMFEGWDYLSSKGIAPALSVFHPLPGSVFYDKPAPTVDYLFSAVQKEYEIYKKYNFTGLLCKRCNRNALDNEAAEGYFR